MESSLNVLHSVFIEANHVLFQLTFCRISYLYAVIFSTVLTKKMNLFLARVVFFHLLLKPIKNLLKNPAFF